MPLVLASNATALDTSNEEKTCSEIGFKKKTEAHANCVLELISRKKNDTKKPQVNIERQTKYDMGEPASSRHTEQTNALQAEQLELQKKILEETRRANEEAKQRDIQKRKDEALRDWFRDNQRRQDAAERERERQQDEVNRVQQQLWDANQKKIDRDWRGY